jgi:hypothetical protein
MTDAASTLSLEATRLTSGDRRTDKPGDVRRGHTIRYAGRSVAARPSIRRVATVLVLTAALATAACGGDSDGAEPPATITTTTVAAPLPPLRRAVADVERLLDGIAQDGLVLGDPKAQIHIIEYASLECQACNVLHEDVIPRLIQSYVRTGEATIEFRTLASSARSLELALGAYGAVPQRRGWHMIQLAYLRADRVSSTPLAAETPAAYAIALGLDLAHWRRDRGRKAWVTKVQAALSVFKVARWTKAPVFLLRRADYTGPFVELTSPRSLADFLDAIDAARSA